MIKAVSVHFQLQDMRDDPQLLRDVQMVVEDCRKTELAHGCINPNLMGFGQNSIGYMGDGLYTRAKVSKERLHINVSIAGTY